MAEIITVERRRRWSEEDKRRIVAEALTPEASVSAVAKRHGLHPGQVFAWRRALRDGALGGARSEPSAAFAPVMIGEPVDARPAEPVAMCAKESRLRDRIEIMLGRGCRVVVGPDVDAAALRRVLDALERR